MGVGVATHLTVTELMAYYYGELPQPDHFYGYTYFATHGRTDAPTKNGEYPPAGRYSLLFFQG